ncbi:MAG: UDP-N-acetylglucosamine 1-carboxyvinyltransferase [Oscillospiraceae bacterium]|nr:UDP-N-acetylglucosamine 1-carboxyvinyltransferase [Oscillospiraceae bacterium]
MKKLKITGGARLSGSIKVQGSKNSALPILAAAIVSGGETTVHNCPAITDVEAALDILRYLGCRAERNGESVFVDSSGLSRTDVPERLMSRMRGSLCFLGAVLCRAGEVRLGFPGGCRLGPRPIDIHVRAMRDLGITAEDNGSELVFKAEKPHGGVVELSFPSVGATENALLAASGIRGTTVIKNAAREPEINDLAAYLWKLGVPISGAGTPEITIEGGLAFEKSAEHSLIPDRIAAATYLCAAASAGGRIELLGAEYEGLAPIAAILTEMGCEIKTGKNKVELIRNRPMRAPKRAIVTGPYPAFPTDAQPPLMAAALLCEGETVFTETMFESRLRHAGELIKLGADIRVSGNKAVVRGVKNLAGAEMQAEDLRGGAALTVAALAAEGESVISGMEFVERGYERFEKALKEIGAQAEAID